jgi:protein associated with RNAse G/E
MRQIRVLSKKYDGTLRDEYETYLSDETYDTVTLFSLPGIMSWDYRKEGWSTATDGLIEIYSKTRWFHVWHIAERIKSSHRIYVHIALPATFNEQLLEWTDLDLDFRVYPDNSIEFKDQGEFEHNIERMGYPSQLVEQAWAACREVEAGIVEGISPFDHEQQVEQYYRLKNKHAFSSE